MTEHYVNNAELTATMTAWKKEWNDAPADAKPRLPESVGEAALKIAERLAQKYNFKNYSYRDDLVASAMVSVSLYAHNFDPVKCKVGGAFSYVTQICFQAMVRTVQIENKHSYIKAKVINESPDKSLDVMRPTGYEIIQRFEQSTDKRKAKQKVKRTAQNAEEFADEDIKQKVRDGEMTVRKARKLSAGAA